MERLFVLLAAIFVIDCVLYFSAIMPSPMGYTDYPQPYLDFKTYTRLEFDFE